MFSSDRSQQQEGKKNPANQFFLGNVPPNRGGVLTSDEIQGKKSS